MDIQLPITAVTVFLDRAQITRRGPVSLQAGAQELVVGALPARLEADSLRASGRGAVAVQIVGVEARERALEKAAHPTARDLQGELERIQDAGKLLEKRDDALLQRLETVCQLSENAAIRYARALAEGKTDLEAAARFLEFIAEQTEQINAQRAELERQKRENAAQQVVLVQQLKQFNAGRKARETVVSVWIEAQSAGDWELEISYSIAGASWRPVYDARVALEPTADELRGHLNLTYGALLTQQTGEDWPAAQITLSTARPNLGTLPPKLQPIFVDVPQFAPVGRRRAPALMADADEEPEFGMSDMIMSAQRLESTIEQAPIEAEEIEAQIETSGATVTFGLARPLGVPSDGQPHRATIVVRDFPAELDFQAIPRLASWAFLRAKIQNAADLTLLEGEVRVFRDGTFVGNSQLQAVAPGGEIQLFLGPDEAIKCEREMVARETDKNFIGNQKRLHFGYQIELESLKSHPVKLEILDQIPVSRSENIKVKLRDAQPQAEQSELHVLTWNLVLAPKEKRKIRFDFGVEAPRETTIVGLVD